MAGATPPTNSYVRDSGRARAIGSLSLDTPSPSRHSRSPQALSPGRSPFQRDSSVSSPSAMRHRSPSSMSQHSRSSTPSLHRKASANSLRGVGSITPSRSPSTRRSSSTMAGSSTLAEVEEQIPRLPTHTPESVAHNCFKAELEFHQSLSKDSRNADTCVIINDSCYGHKFSRSGIGKDNTKEQDLRSIVERPERLKACINGLSIAYVLLGERHSGGQHAPYPGKVLSEVSSIPFQIIKTTRQESLSSPAVKTVHGPHYSEELSAMCNRAESKLAARENEIARIDMPRNTTEKPAELHIGDLYLSPESKAAIEGGLGATNEGVDVVFDGSASGNGPFRSFVLVRPPGHHCSSDFPSGFCWVNNVHVGIQHAVAKHGLTHAAIIDIDLHHGDGSQKIVWANNMRTHESNRKATKNGAKCKKPSIGYFSLNDIQSFPCEDGDMAKVIAASTRIENVHNQTIWNIDLIPWKTMEEFWKIYEEHYLVLLDKARNFLQAQTKRYGSDSRGAIFLSVGFDGSILETADMQRHPVNFPVEFYARFAQDLVHLANEEECGVGDRIICVLEGGYSDQALSTGVLSLISGLTAGKAIANVKKPDLNGLGSEMAQKIKATKSYDKRDGDSLATYTYNASLLTPQALKELDAMLNPPVVGGNKKPKVTAPSTYSDPTKSSIARIAASPRGSSVLSKLNGMSMESRSVSPIPEVSQAVAIHEMRKLLTPEDQPTTSHRYEDLAANRGKRVRQSTVPASNMASVVDSLSRMTLQTDAKALSDLPGDRGSNKQVPRISLRKIGKTAANPMLESASNEFMVQPNRRASTASIGIASDVPPRRSSRASIGGRSSVMSSYAGSKITRPDSSASVRTISTRKPKEPIVPRPDPVLASRLRKKSPLSDNSLNSEEPVKTNPAPSVNLHPSSATSTTVTKPVAAKKKIVTKPIKPLAGVEAQDLKVQPVTKSNIVEVGNAEKSPSLPNTAALERPLGNLTLDTKISSETPKSELCSAPSTVVGNVELRGLDTSSSDVEDVLTPMIARALTVGTPPSSTTTDDDFSRVGKISPEMQYQRSTMLSPTANKFIAYEPNGPPSANFVQHNSLQWVPPNTSATPPMKRDELPVFTSTSAIPFAHPKPNPSP